MFKLNRISILLIIPVVGIVCVVFTALWFAAFFAIQQSHQASLNDLLSHRIQVARTTMSNHLKKVPNHMTVTTEGKKTVIDIAITKTLETSGFQFHESFAVLSSDGDKILYAYPNIERVPNDRKFQKLTAFKDGIPHKINIHQGNAISTYIRDLDVHLVAISTQNFMSTPAFINFKSKSALILLICAASIILVIALLLHYRISTPLRHMAKTMHNITSSDTYRFNVSETGADEIKELARQFNLMITHIRKRDKSLHKQNDKLEDTVQERTSALQKTQEQLVIQERLAAIGEFSSTITQELRNPLSSIKLGIEKLQQLKNLENKDARRLELMNDEIHRLDQMINGLLAFTYNAPVHMHPYELSEILNEASHTVLPLMKEKNITFETSGIDTKSLIRVDEHRMTQSLVNIIKNGCENSEKNGTVKLTAHYENKYAEIQVTNHGNVISEKMMARIFEPFFTTKASGTGLGLSTTRRFIEEMEGQIDIESNTSKGTTVTIRVPMA